MLIVIAVDAAGMPPAADFEDLIHHVEGIFKVSLVTEQGKQGCQFFAGEPVLLPDTVSDNHDELPVFRNLEPGSPAQFLGRNGNGLHDPVPLFVPHGLFQHLPLLVGGKVAPFLLELGHHLIVNAAVDDEVSVGRAAGAEVGRLTDAGVPGGLLDVGGLVEDHGGVAGPRAVRRFPRTVSGLGHGRPAGGHDEVAHGHKLLDDGHVDFGNALEKIFGFPDGAKPLAHLLHHRKSRLFRPWMGGEDDHVPGLQCIDSRDDGSEFRVGHGNQ
ncbi:hypothetical protein SDC9_92921 [bioreactor metagenome]|uniref:Uncharacterized protein n=1 Tax=bioreactor metagenome TaxID=1076179 RepID=A0A645A5S8_9ZZZZ